MEQTQNSLTIKKVDEETFNEFVGLINKLAEYEKLEPPDDDAKKRLRQDCLSGKPKYQAFIGKIGVIPVSYMIYFFTYSSFLALATLFLEDIFVLEKYRKQGVGKKMIEFIKENAKREGCGRIEFTVLKWNKVAQQFYEENKAQRLEWFLYRITKEDF